MYKREDLTKTAWAAYNSIPNEIPSKYHNNADRLCDFMARVEKVWGESWHSLVRTEEKPSMPKWAV